VISVVLATARPSRGSMKAWPDRDHLAYTLEHLARQEFRDFEVVIADTLHGTHFRDVESLILSAGSAGVPVYHVPVKSPWVERGNWAISGSRNWGFIRAAGDHIFFLDDLSAPEPHVLGAYAAWAAKGKFLDALHGWLEGDAVSPVQDGRLTLFDGATKFRYDLDVNAHASASAEAIEKINGWDEFYDGSRQLEDGDFGRRLRAAGYHTVVDRSVLIREQVPFGTPAPGKRLPAGGSCCSREGAPLGPALRCNGTWIFLKVEAGFAGYERANRGLTEQERAAFRPCAYLQPDQRCRMQPGNPNKCDFGRLPDGRHGHDPSVLPDAWVEAEAFDIAERRRAGLATREQYRIA